MPISHLKNLANREALARYMRSMGEFHLCTIFAKLLGELRKLPGRSARLLNDRHSYIRLPSQLEIFVSDETHHQYLLIAYPVRMLGQNFRRVRTSLTSISSYLG